MPAILKGWCDRVLVMGRIYGGGKIYQTGRFKGRRAVCALTTGGPAPAYATDGFNGDIMGILRPIHRGILEFVGYDVLRPEVVYAPVRQDDAARAAALDAWATRLADIADEAPIAVGRYA